MARVQDLSAWRELATQTSDLNFAQTGLHLTDEKWQ
jgi:hypothetical protein